MKMIDPDLSAYVPERSLWGAVVEQAIHDLGSKSLLILDSAIEWFENRTRTGVGSFVWVCHVLELDPDKIVSYDIKQDKNIIREITIKNLRSERTRELKSSVRWTLEKMFERMKQKN